MLGTGHIFWLKLLKIYDQKYQFKKLLVLILLIIFLNPFDYEKENIDSFIKSTNYKPVSVSDINKKIKKLKMEKRSELIKGDIIKTSNKYIIKNKGFKISLLHLDLDTYQGTKSALDTFYKKISRGGIILLDEYGKRGWGETDAVDEFLDKYKTLKIKTVKFSNQPTSYIVKEV